jgi:hypothetical protein
LGVVIGSDCGFRQAIGRLLALLWSESANQAAGLPFVTMAFDSLYGRSSWLREQWDAAGIEYYADIPANQMLYLGPLCLNLNCRSVAKSARSSRLWVKKRLKPWAQRTETQWESLTLRPNERRMLTSDFAMYKVWVVKHLDNRTCSRRSRLRNHPAP